MEIFCFVASAMDDDERQFIRTHLIASFDEPINQVEQSRRKYI